jgi:hypothetical protein
MATASKVDYKYIGPNAHTLNNGRPVEPGETVKLTKEEIEENQSLIDEGVLVHYKEEGKEG